MFRHMLRSKIHRATVTGADLHYEGSVTIDEDLMDRAGLIPYEAVDVWNVTNGERFSTYALAGQRGAGVVCINGAAAHKAGAGDIVIIACFGWMDDAEARQWMPRLVFVDAQNRAVESRAEHAGQMELSSAWPQ